MALALAAPRRARQQRLSATACPRGPASTSCATASGRRSTWARPATCAPGCARTSAGRQPPRSKARCRRSTASTRRPRSELEAALDELDLIRRWRPPGNVRDARPDRSVYLRLGLADHAPALGVRDGGARRRRRYAGPFPSRRLATEAAEALRDAYGLRTCRPRLPVDDGRCLRGARALPGTVPRRRRRTRLRRSARALAAWLAGEEACVDAPLRERVARLVAQHRFEDAARAHAPAGFAARGAMRSSRRSGARAAGRASCSQPTSTRATSSRSRSCAARSSPSAVCRARAIPASSSGAVAQRSSAPLDPAAALAPRAEGPWLPAERSAEALLLAQAFAGRAPGVVPIACTAPDALALKRVEGARRRGRCAWPPPRAGLRHARADELAAVA